MTPVNQAVPARPSRKPLYVAALLAVLVGGLGGLATDIGPWYFSLVKPSWQPPDWLFGPVWSTIYLLTAIAGVRAWRRGNPAQHRQFLLALAVNLVLNVLWSVLFFTVKRPDWALFEVAALWLSIAWLALVMRPYAPLSAALLLPYLLWVAFAGYLNWTILRLNGPF